MFINNKSIKTFGAKVEKKYISSVDIESNIEWLKGNLLPTLLDTEISFKTINIELLFRAKNRDLILQNISNFIKETIECDIRFRNLSNNYHCFITNHSQKESEFDDWLFLELEFIGYEYSNEITLDCSNVLTKTINVLGNKNTPVILEITPSINAIDLIINGLSEDPIKIKNLKANNKIIINGADGTTLEGTTNKFSDIDLWEFPFLCPGENNISFSRNDMQIKIKYKPMWH